VADEESNNGKPTSNDTTQPVSTLPFDRSRVWAEREVATLRLLARLKAIDSTKEAQSSRVYASRYIREQEPLILRLLDAGVGIEEIIADLAISFPSIPKADLRYAIAQLRDRRRKQIGASATRSEGAHRLTQRPAPREAEECRPPRDPLATQSDQRPDESDEDYRLRRSLDGTDGVRQQFIGEH